MKIICDKCNKIMHDTRAYSTYSFSKGYNVVLCKECYDDLEKALHEADKKFFMEAKLPE